MCYNNNGDDMKKRRIKKGSIVVLIFVVVVIVFGVTYTINTINYHKTYDYKLKKIGYNDNEVETIEKLSDKSKDYILTLEYNKDIISLLKEKYFIEDNLKDYVDYYLNNDSDYTDTVSIINVGANKDWYTDTKKTDLSKGHLMLTNKFNSLDESYNSDDMVKISNQYSYGDNQMVTEETYNAFIEMFNAAKKEDLTLIINSSYRSFEDQEETYDYYKSTRGEREADKIAARAGFSEHQTGMAVDIQTYGSTGATFEEFDEFKWLSENAYKYGFILRYPKGKEYLTGYEYESWHYRYVGIEAATYIHDNDITFDEYYAYFVEKD